MYFKSKERRREERKELVIAIGQHINNLTIIWDLGRNKLYGNAYFFFHHPFINPIVNPADILPVNGIPKLVIASEEADFSI